MRNLQLGAATAAILALGACSDTGTMTSGASTGSTAATSAYAGTATPSPPAASLTPLSAADVTFIFEAAHGGAGEVEMGQLAQSQGTTPAVRDLGTRMVQDHTAANQELQSLAQSKGVQPPGVTDRGRQVAGEILRSLSGPTFDREYIKDQIAEHRMAIALFQVEAANGEAPTLKSFAQRTLPTLQHHLDMFTRAGAGAAVSRR